MERLVESQTKQFRHPPIDGMLIYLVLFV